MAVFNHTDDAGDEFEVLSRSSNVMSFHMARKDDGRSQSVYIDRDAVFRLRDALNDWLGSPASDITPVPVYPADSVYGQLIRKAVAEEVARVLPLHQAPVSAPDDPNPACFSCPHTRNDHGRGLSTACDCGFCPEFTADPEPHDVGHPVYEDARPHPVNTDPAPGFLGATLPVGPVRCGGCGHGWNDHTFGVCWGSDATSCNCTRERPAPVPVVQSDKVWGEQGAPPEPVALECICDKHNHRPAVRGTSTACVYRDCECKYRGAS